MEKHRCKVCSKCFPNGRSLGGHMKLHQLVGSQPPRMKLSESQTDSASSSSASSVGKSPVYRLRANPRRSFRVANLDSGSPSLLDLDDRDVVEKSETESEPDIQVRKRVRKPGGVTRRERTKKKTTAKPGRNSEESEKKKTGQHSNESTTESPDSVSLISYASPEEDLAMCLIMLSKDSRKLKNPAFEKSEKGEEEVKTGKRQCMELQRRLIDLNFPPPPGEEEEEESIDRSEFIDREILTL